MLRVGGSDALGLLLPLGQGLGIDIEFHGREGLEKRIHDPGIDRIGRNILTHRGPILLAEVVTDVAGAALILHDHLVAAFPAVDEAVQEGFARARDPPGFVAVIRGAFHTRSPKRLRRGSNRSWVLNTSTTLLAERHCKNVSNTNDRRAWASWLGILCTVPCPLRTKPVGSVRANSPRVAFWMSPAVRRAFMVCRSHSDSVPFKPKRRRPLTVAGS